MASVHARAPLDRQSSASLICGIVLAPAFFLTVFVQAFARLGFDIRRAPLSLLSLGDLGWIQIANFIATGLLGLACAAGVRRALLREKGGTWGPLLIVTFGLGMLLAGIFHPDPGYNFPPGSGAPSGMLPTMSGHAAVHSAGFMVVVVSLVVASFVLARAFHFRGEKRWSRYSVATGVLAPVLLGTGIATNIVPLITLMAIILFGWLSATSAHLRAGLDRRAIERAE